MRKFPFLLLAILSIVLAVITFIEKYNGTPYVQDCIYSSTWFYILWSILSVFSFHYIISEKLYKRRPAFLLHASFFIILLGAITTAMTAERGIVLLPYGAEVTSYQQEDGAIKNLPFTLQLKDFKVEYYSGTNAASDYTTLMTITSGDNLIVEKRVSMNKIARYEGYRFYQSNYDNSGSWLSINRDVYGIPITYSGYLLLLFSFVYLFIDRKGQFRLLLRKAMSRGFILCLLFFSSALGLKASSPRTLTQSQCESLEMLQVVYNDRVMPLASLANDYTLKLTQDVSLDNITSEQFFWGWLLFPSEWESVPLFEVPQSRVQDFLGLEPISAYKDFFTPKGVYKLNHYLKNTDAKTQPALYKELVKLNEKIQLVAMLRSGAMIKIFPFENNDGLIS